MQSCAVYKDGKLVGGDPQEIKNQVEYVVLEKMKSEPEFKIKAILK
jgi:hypothetical protein